MTHTFGGDKGEEEEEEEDDHQVRDSQNSYDLDNIEERDVDLSSHQNKTEEFNEERSEINNIDDVSCKSNNNTYFDKEEPKYNKENNNNNVNKSLNDISVEKEVNNVEQM